MPNEYDRIFKENMEEVVLSTSRILFGFEVLRSRELTGKLQHTIEREPDFIRVVETTAGEEFIFHLEFQSRDDLNMLRRMRLYHAMLDEKYRLPIRQVVLYIGQAVPRMRTRFRSEEVMSGFELLDLHRLDVGQFLDSVVPEEVLLAVLADFGSRDSEVVMRLIMRRLRELGEDENRLQRWLQQLKILSRIPKLEETYLKLLQHMPIELDYDVKEDAFYKWGRREGREEGRKENREELVMFMLKEGKLSEEDIARYSKLSLEEVRSLKKES